MSAFQEMKHLHKVIEVERIGVGKHEEFHRLIKKLNEIYLNRKGTRHGVQD
jgi:hypothetical protein